MAKSLKILIICLACLTGIQGCGGSGHGSRLPEVDEVQFGPLRHESGRNLVDVAWPSAGATLRGTLYLPHGLPPRPAVMMHFGSNKWSRPIISFGVIDPWLNGGIAVLVYDKRGVGQSTGKCCPVSDPAYFPLLASDLIAGVAAISRYPDVDPNRVGLYGFSQGGWVVPDAAARSPSVAFTIIGSGPAVSLGEEELYSKLVGGDDGCTPTGISSEEIDAALTAAGPSGFDPRSDLEMYVIPGYWFYGGNDLSVPVPQSVHVLEEVHATFQKDFTIKIYPDANHSLIPGGAICQESGDSVDYFTPIYQWLAPILFGTQAAHALQAESSG